MSGRNMSPFRALYRRELSAFFQTPVAYVVGGIFLAVSAALFFSVFFLFDRAEMRQFFGSLPLLLALITPALSMRLVAEERRRGTWEVLTTLPVYGATIILAKFAAVWTTVLAFLAPTLLFALTVSGFGRLDPGPVLGGYLGTLLLSGLYAAIGVFSSARARSETVALVLGLVISLGLALLESFIVLMPLALVPVLEYASIGVHFADFARGLIDTRSIIYFLTTTAAFLVLARRVIGHEQAVAKRNTVLLIAVLLMINLVGTNSYRRIDATRSSAYSLSEVSQETLRRVEDPLRILVFYNDQVPAPYNGVRQYLLDLLREYDAAENQHFSYEVIDPTTDEGRLAAQRYGLQQIEIQEIRSDEFASRAVYVGAVVLYGNVVERLDRITSTEGLEYRLTTAMRSAVTQVDALSGTSDPVELIVMASPGLEELGIEGFPQLETQMLAIHERVNADNFGRIRFSYIEPEGPAELQTLSDELGVQLLRWQNADGQERDGVLDMALRLGDRVELIPLQIYPLLFGGYSLGEPAELEDAVRQGLRSLVTANPRIAYAQGSGEKDLSDAQRGAGAFAQLAGQSYELLPVDLATADIPADIDTLIVNGPTGVYSQAALYRLDQFVLRGGSLLLLIDRHNEIVPSQQELFAGAQPTWQYNEPGLAPLLEHWGLSLTDQIVLDEESFVVRGQGGQQQLFQAPVLGGSRINRDSPITAGLEDLIVLNATELLPAPAPSDGSAMPGYTPLLQTSERSWTIDDPAGLGPWITGAPADGDLGTRDVAVMLEGSFRSWFDGPVPLDPDAPADGLLQTQRHRDESRAPGMVLVVSTSALTTGQLIDPQTRTPNGVFLMNALDVLNGAAGIAELRSKGLGVSRLEITNPASRTVARWFNMIAAPGSAAVVGLVVWNRRRARTRRIQRIFSETTEAE